MEDIACGVGAVSKCMSNIDNEHCKRSDTERHETS